MQFRWGSYPPGDIQVFALNRFVTKHILGFTNLWKEKYILVWPRFNLRICLNLDFWVGLPEVN
jgi:hypothetical protein